MNMMRVVVADDEAIIRMDLVETLKAAGYDVVGQARDGQAALELIQSTQPDVAILDVKMPLRDGMEVAHAVRDSTPVVLLTAFGQADIIAQAKDAGVMGYVIKPFSSAEIIAAIEIAHMRFREMRELHAERDELADSLETRKLLDRAKGLLQKHMSISEPDAFRWIQKAAMDRRLAVRDVAETVIAELGNK
jgi:two-component system, response regulator PdtaR